MSPYAQGTEVSSDRSKTEIERTLRRFGADQFAYGWEDDRVAVGFRVDGRAVRINITMPDSSDPSFRVTPTGRQRSASAAIEEYEKEARRRWRALANVIKAKLVAVEEGISTIEREFQADILLPNGKTVGEWIAPGLAEMCDTGKMLELLPGGR